MKFVNITFLLLFLFCFTGCSFIHIQGIIDEEPLTQEEIDLRNNNITNTQCFEKPKSGGCRAIHGKGYYYDPVDGKCKSFTYCGESIIPFATLTECENQCICEKRRITIK